MPFMLLNIVGNFQMHFFVWLVLQNRVWAVDKLDQGGKIVAIENFAIKSKNLPSTFVSLAGLVRDFGQTQTVACPRRCQP
jgi:hypothetical protein